MICRHASGDPDCSSNKREYYYSYSEPVKTPDSKNYSIEDVVAVGKNVVLKVKYPNCSNCAFEGTKVMVFLNTTLIEVIKWKEIDPHFREQSKSFIATKAPSPAARFPSSANGWNDALEYARVKQ